jgi:hypothetical protein
VFYKTAIITRPCVCNLNEFYYNVHRILFRSGKTKQRLIFKISIENYIVVNLTSFNQE